jgi:archaetidylinositol phosphate synthase
LVRFRVALLTTTMPRISHSLLDPFLTRPLKALYPRLRIPAWLPPEAIVGCGHLAAIAGAVGFAFSTSHGWGGVLAALGVAANHTCDVLDGTHARATNQCRNGGELLDHFVDPLSFCYWVAGLAYAGGAPWLAALGVGIIYATSVLTNIRAKMIGEFTLARFGPTEFKTLLVAFALLLAVLVPTVWSDCGCAVASARWFVILMSAAGLLQLVVMLIRSVREVNTQGTPPADTTEWEIKK